MTVLSISSFRFFFTWIYSLRPMQRLLTQCKLLLALVLLARIHAFAAVGDDAQLVSNSIPAGTQIMPRTVFIQTWTFLNTGTNTWTPGQSGCTLNIRGTDSLGAIRVTPNSISSAYHPSATINSGQSVPPGGQASFSMTFIA